MPKVLADSGKGDLLMDRRGRILDRKEENKVFFLLKKKRPG